MHFLLPVVLVATVYGRDMSDVGYYPAQPYHETYVRTYLYSPPPPEVNERRYEVNDPNRGNFEDHRPFNSKNRGQVINNEYNRDFPSNDRNGRRHLPNEGQRQTHGVAREMDVNLAFDRQGNQKRQSNGNMNLPRQSFNVNNEYSNRDDVTNNDSNRSFNQNAPTGREEGDMVFRNNDGDNSKRKTAVEPNTNNSPDNDVPKIGIITFLNNVNNNSTNQNTNSYKEVINQNDQSNNNNRNGFKSDTELNADQRPSKTTIENEVTANPFLRSPIDKRNQTLDEDKWVWDDGGKPEIVEGTTEATTLVTLDDRAAFTGDKCATGMARVQGKCVVKDK